MSFNYKIVVISCILLVLAFSAGCSSEEDSCAEVLSGIDQLESSADGRVKTMDFSSSDEFLLSQVEASGNQYRDAMDGLIALGPSSCLSGYAYEVRLKSLQLKIDFLDVFSELNENDNKAVSIFQTSTPEFRKGLVEVLDEYSNIRERILYLDVFALGIDTTLLSPQYADMIPIVTGELDTMLNSVDYKISFLSEYR